MEPVDTLITARWVIPIEPGAHVLDHHAVAIRQGRIVAVEPAARAMARFTAAEHIDRPSHVVLPGLVNAHTRTATTLLRGAAESSPQADWLLPQAQPPQRRWNDVWSDAEYVRDATELAIADLLTSGTTCFADLHLFPDRVAQTAAAANIRACVGLPVLDGASAWAETTDEHLDKGLRLYDEYRDDPLITTALAPYSETVSDETLRRVQRTADELELPVTMPVLHGGGEGSLLRLERLGLLSPLLLAIHMVQLDQDDLLRAARGGINVVHCPQANLKLGHGVCPVLALRAHGINLTLGTDSPASNNDLSLLGELRCAALLASGLPVTRAVLGAHTALPMSAHDWLQVATLNGARALGLADSIGSLTVGKWADVCCVDLARPHTQPLYDPAVQLVYSASRDQVSDVWVAGRRLLAEGRLTRLDTEDLLQRARRWQNRIAAA